MQRTIKEESEFPQAVVSLCRIPEVARILNVSTRSVWRLLRTGALRPVKCGRAIRVARKCLDEFIERGGTSS